MKMTMKVWFIVLCSGILKFSLAENRLRFYFNTYKESAWETAQTMCVEENGSLLSMYDEEDANMIYKFIKSVERTVWLGLKYNDSYVPTWSNGEKVIFKESTVNLTEEEQLCVAIENGTWKGFHCSEEKTFLCQNGPNYILVETEKNWCQAMHHCRRHFTDLASINGTQQNKELKDKNQGKSFWIGLRHDKFQWADKICSTYREKVHNMGQQKSDSKCVSIIKPSNNTWELKGCELSYNIICTQGSVKIRLINESKTWEEALDYCTTKHSRLLWIEDDKDQMAVKQWLNLTTTDFIERLWIGMRQSSVFGFWIWSDQIVTWTNDPLPTMPFSHRCGVIDAKTYAWGGENCWSQLPFLCEEDIIYA